MMVGWRRPARGSRLVPGDAPVPADDIAAVLRAHVDRHRRWWREMQPKMIWLWQKSPRHCPVLSDRMPLPQGEETDPLAAVSTIAALLERDPRTQALIARTIPAGWYGIGVFFEGWYASAEPASAQQKRIEAAGRERALHLLPGSEEVRYLALADRDGRTYGVHLSRDHRRNEEPITEWWSSGSRGFGPIVADLECIAATFTTLVQREH